VTVTGELALETARRLLDPQAVLAAAGDGNASLGSGLAGTALLHARLAAADPAFATAATRHWAAAARHARHQGGGIYPSPGGLAASLITGVSYLPDPGSHHAAVTRAARWLSRHALEVSRDHHERQQGGEHATPVSVYDTITGLAGTGRVLLTAVTAGHVSAEPGLHAALQTLTAMIRATAGSRLGWQQPATPEQPADTCVTGIAHGVAGPLATLSAAHAAGWSTTGQAAAISDASRWLLHCQDSSMSWPPYITDGDPRVRVPGRRDAWCYGAPGIGRALALAGKALGDEALTTAGQKAIATVATRHPSQWDTDGPTLCHGTAGILQSTATSPPAARARSAAATSAAYDPQQPFAFRHTQNGNASDRPGFLTGAAGIALALADHAELPEPATLPARWDSLLLLS
jgi:hypothetical protein